MVAAIGFALGAQSVAAATAAATTAGATVAGAATAAAGATAAAAGLGLSAIGTTLGVAGQVATYNTQKKQAATQQKAQDLQTRRQRRAAVRSNILASSRARATAQATGVSQSSGLSGGLGSARSNFGSELGYGTQMSGLSQQASELGQRASVYSDVSKLGFGAMNFGLSSSGQNFLKNTFYT